MCRGCRCSATLLILVVILLAACGRSMSCPSSGSISVSLATPQPADVLLELAWEGGLDRPERAFAFGRVPEFSLLPDGYAYYRDPPEWDEAQMMVAHLTPAERQELVQRVLDLGIERLESYTDACQLQTLGSCLCVADAGESAVRVRLPGGELREIRNYHTFANEPEVLEAIRSLLQDYRHPQAEAYQPARAAFFIRLASPPSDLPVRDWPLDPAWLTGSTSDYPCARTLFGTDLQALLAMTERNMGDFYFRDPDADQVYNVYLVPWLPGVDYTDLIASSGQACPPVTKATAQEPFKVQDTPAITGAPVVLAIRAYIDGRSQLVVHGDTVYWHHLDFAAPGRHLHLEQGTDEPTYLNEVAWYPTWPDRPDAENRDCGCNSSAYVGIPPLAALEQEVSLEPVRVRQKPTIVQQPGADNDYTLILEFADNALLGPDWYEVDISYITGDRPVSVPTSDAQCPTPTPAAVPTMNPLSTLAAFPGMPQPGATLTRPMNKDEMNMRYVPAGPFTMGSPEGVGESIEHPQHVVTLNAFWLDETEVTQAHYETCVAAGACDAPPMDDYALSGKPVVVTWGEAQTYCRWVGGRLPTEAEWEKAARGSDARIYPWGDEQPDCSLANHASLEGACSDGPVDAGAYPAGASPYGVLDMAGNVAEWVSDWYDPGYYAVSPDQNPQGPDSGQARVARGGSWEDHFPIIRAAYRVAYPPDEVALGFRCVAPAAAYTVIESDRYAGWYRYTNLDYGFSFHYPPDWALEERLHRLVFHHQVVDTLRFTVEYRRVDEDPWVFRTGMPAGDFVPRGSVPFLGQALSRNVLVYEGKDKLIGYDLGAGARGDLIFGCTLEDFRDDYEALDLPEDVQRQIDQVVTSFALEEVK